MTDTITVVGNIATNPEQRKAGDIPVTSFRVASSERRPDPQGGWMDGHTNYYTVSAFRSLAEHAFRSLRRGERVIVTGRLRVKEWDAGNGTKGRSVEIDAEALGHDLRFGTSVFQRGTRPDQAATSDAVDTSATGSGSWSTPGDDGWAPAAADGGAGDADGEDDRVPRDLVSAGATPF